MTVDQPVLPRLTLLGRLAYPILLLAVVGTATAAIAGGWELGQVNFAFLLGTIGYLALLERLIPYQRAWHPTRKEWGWYGIYFIITVLGGAIASLIVSAILDWVATADPALPLWAEIPLALLLGSLASYAVHRAGHTNNFLWRLHGVHHVPEKVNVANNGVGHIVDVVFAQGVTQLSLALVGFSRESVFAVGLFVIAQGYFVHANIDVRIGWLNHVFGSPEQHRLHHSVNLRQAGHYSGDLSVWDHVFGSFTWKPGREPDGVGLHDPTSFPDTGRVLASQLQPWWRKARER
ncbi:sterol desaturase/sphingolipid hydroxylase (fatty acid hydroxylase superfamily) [Crossiella equi]|uniref:Sterol desaturase/sphingolipid hydroxylase (Fatty acid hydroxylase superfamily) n=1 Tax=Crossiella equi TaxID=130796 RepID=A0ABS5AN98_9PSEU|nr:sterol desaturase family protein [Crossiella equi]MBP2477891.1 sterol desaturase/sphingolipid hydroxylase (fatty acid hydroxylase superfamily) [Crossiella equi]